MSEEHPAAAAAAVAATSDLHPICFMEPFLLVHSPESSSEDGGVETPEREKNHPGLQKPVTSKDETDMNLWR